MWPFSLYMNIYAKGLEINHQFIKRQSMGLNNINKVPMLKTNTAYIDKYLCNFGQIR